MRKALILLLLIPFLGCSSGMRYSQAPESRAPDQVFPGEGYCQTYNPNVDALFLALRGYDSNGVSVNGPTDFPSIPLRTLERRRYYRADPNSSPENPGGFFLGNGEYWDGENWIYPRYPRPRYYPYPVWPWQPRTNNQEDQDKPAGSSFNGGPVHQGQGFQDNHGSSGIPGQEHHNTHR